MERGLYHPIEFSCEHMAVVETGDVETNVALKTFDPKKSVDLLSL
jgi:hypothetical protein